jgi:CubicO group peptidase (beta-lactamase class C family)
MRPSRRLPLLALPALWLVTGCNERPEPPRVAVAAPGDLEADLARIVPPLLEEHRVPGAAVAVLLDREIVLVRGFGRLRAGDEAPKVDERTIFQAASLSKPVFARGVHRLLAEPAERRGKPPLTLDRPLAAYRPPDEPYEHDDPRLGRITARHVLSHTTGFPNWRPDNWSDAPKPLRIKAEPGARFGYSGEGYVWLQRVVEQITGETLDVYLRRTVLEPLDMRDSSFVWEERFEAVHASPHDGKGDPRDKWRPRAALAAGTLQTTATDYARFMQAVLRDERSDGSPGTWLARESTVDPERGLGWSLGLGYEEAEGGDVFWQWGDDGTFKALVAGSHARGVAVVVFTNAERGLNVARAVVERVLGEGLRFLDFRMLSY